MFKRIIVVTWQELIGKTTHFESESSAHCLSSIFVICCWIVAPGPPQSATADEASSADCLDLSWKTPAKPNGKITHYEVSKIEFWLKMLTKDKVSTHRIFCKFDCNIFIFCSDKGLTHAADKTAITNIKIIGIMILLVIYILFSLYLCSINVTQMDRGIEGYLPY